MKKDSNHHDLNTEVAPSTRPKGVSYKFRAECESDSFLVRVAFANWVLAWHERRDFPYPDVEVEMELLESAPKTEELSWLIRQLVDCHVIEETLELSQHYTGERRDRPRQSVRPLDEIISTAENPLSRAPEALKNRGIRAQEAAIALRKTLRPSAKDSK